MRRVSFNQQPCRTNDEDTAFQSTFHRYLKRHNRPKLLDLLVCGLVSVGAVEQRRFPQPQARRPRAPFRSGTTTFGNI